MKTIYILTVTLLIFTACQKKINFDASLISSQLVVNGFIEQDSLIDILVATSKPIPGVVQDFIWITDATVVLYEDGVKKETLDTYDIKYVDENNQDYWYNDSAEKRPSKGYRSKLKAKVGKTYKLEISHPDYNNVTCETEIPKPVDIISVDTVIVNDENPYWQETKMKVAFKFKDSGDEANYYRMIAYLKKGQVELGYYEKEIMDTFVYISEEYIAINDPIINPEQEDANDILFNSPYNKYNVFTDELINGKEYTINFDFRLFSGNRIDSIDYEALGEFYEIKLILQSISRENYLYLKSSFEHQYYDGDLFVEPVQVYSNVENGIGIFAGYSSSQFIIKAGEYPIDNVKYINQDYSYYR